MVELFTIGMDGLVSLNKPWIALIPEFQKIITSDKGSEGDHDGRKKLLARRKFTYLYLMLDFKSPLENYEEKQRKEVSLTDSGLTRGQVEADILLYEAEKKYKEMVENSSQTIRTYRKLKNKADALTDYIEFVDLDERTESGGAVIKIKEIQDAIKNMPSMMKSLNELELLVKQEMEGTGLRGDATKGEDEDPD